MISNKSRSIILLGGIMLSSAAFTIGTSNNNYQKNTAVYAINKNASESEVSNITNTAIINEVKDNNGNEESTNKEEGNNSVAVNKSNINTFESNNNVLDLNDEKIENIKNSDKVDNTENINVANSNTTDISKENFVEKDSSDEKFSTVDNSIVVDTSNSNNNLVDSKDEKLEKVENVEISDEVSNTEKTDVDNSITESDIENNDKIESDTNNNESKVYLDNNNDEGNNVDSDTNNNNNNNIASETQDNEIEDSNINTDIAVAGNTITCPELSEAPTFEVAEGNNKNGIGDSVYNHLKELGWTVIDENTIKINDDRLQFKNMNGQAGIDSIITITADFAENDKYVLYLLKLMIGDKSISTAKPTESEIYSGKFDDTYYDNFENLVRRIANGTGNIKYSNRNVRVQYDGNWDYTITVTFYNYTDGNTSNTTTPSINGNINILY